jgi:phage-related protein (TIGR01555 family)
VTQRLFLKDSLPGQVARRVHTSDSFQNFQAQLGYGTNNVTSGSTYGFNPVTRNRNLLEWSYRGSWVVGVAVDAVAEDMTRAGIEIMSGMRSDHIEQIQIGMQELGIWNKIQDTIKWGRLYGGACGVMMLEGQNPSTPLRPETVGFNQFKGMVVFDRWMLTPSLQDIVTEAGPDAGMPRFYKVIQNAPVYAGKNIHYSRIMRIDGIELPFYQRMTENLWSISILERLYDRLLAYDSTSVGAAQLVYKAHIRTLSIEHLRELIAMGGKSFQAVIKQIDMIRQLQVNEGITLLDASDKFEAHQYAFSGLGDMLLQFAQQVAGALQIPLVRLLGQAPAGLNATGDSDFRNYYDGIKAQQEARMRRPMHSMLAVLCRSRLGCALPKDFSFQFTPLWQMSALEKSELAARTTATITQAFEAGMIDKATALEELRANSRISGIWTSITDELIAQAKLMPPAMPGSNQVATPASGDPGQPPVALQAKPKPRGLLAPPKPTPIPSNPDMTGPEDTDDGEDDMDPDNGMHTTEIDLHLEHGEIDVIPA